MLNQKNMVPMEIMVITGTMGIMEKNRL